MRAPSLEEQRRIVAYLDDLQARVDALKQLQAQTQTELDALLPSVLLRSGVSRGTLTLTLAPPLRFASGPWSPGQGEGRERAPFSLTGRRVGDEGQCAEAVSSVMSNTTSKRALCRRERLWRRHEPDRRADRA